jgi:hypothetical protein
MANKKKESLNKAYVSVGKVKVKQADGTKKDEEKFIILSETLAKYIGAIYSTALPAPIKVEVKRGQLAGRSHLRERSVKIAGTRYQVGYVDGLKPAVNGQKRQAKIKWISLYVTAGITLRILLKAIRTKFAKKPVYFRTPAGVTTRFVFQ